jgi:hypothetical protein
MITGRVTNFYMEGILFLSRCDKCTLKRSSITVSAMNVCYEMEKETKTEMGEN